MLSQILESVNKRYVNSVKGDYWKGSYFEDIVKLTNDERGKWGEHLFRDLIKYPTIEMPVMWDADKNTDPVMVCMTCLLSLTVERDYVLK